MKKMDLFLALQRLGILNLLAKSGVLSARDYKFFSIACFHASHPDEYWMDACLDLKCEKSEYYEALKQMSSSLSFTPSEYQLLHRLLRRDA